MRKLLFLCFFIAIGMMANAQSSDELRRQQAEIQKEIDDLKETLRATQKNKKASLGQLALVQQKLRLRQKAIDNISAQINMIQGTINQSRSEINKLRMELDTLKNQYEKSVMYAYKNRSNYDFLNFVFSAASFNDAVKRVEYLKTYRNFRQQQAENIKTTQNQLQQKIAMLEQTRKQKDEVLGKQEKEKMVLQEEKKEKDDVVKGLKAREKEINREITAKARADKKLRDGIAAAIRRETEKARAAAAAAAKKEDEANKASGNTTATAPKVKSRSNSVLESTPEGAIISADFEKNKGRLPWPVDKGRIKIGFGTYSIENTTVNGNNPGLTIETDVNASVKSIFEGEVIAVFDVEGNYAVLVKHGKYFTSYGGLANVSISKGQKVTAGQSLGRASTNNDGSGEIEFLLMRESTNVDPEAWIKRR
ncbi:MULTISPECIES: murein hydrolase activator EnvC family protein [unclassified Paraflavitalea]|uniref:murein hydrolase activator EnvC family protein n=1 Tax=unclassified Paraflavitalea TaxID=2798305 RepID=UPI003D345578